MKISYTVINNSLHVSFDGELDEYSANYVRNNLDNLIEENLARNIKQVVLDLAGLTFMDSTGVGVLLGRFKKFNKMDTVIYIKNPSKHIDKILKMTGVYSIIPKIA